MTDTPRDDTRIALEWLYQAVSEGVTDANYAAVTNAAQVLDLPASLPSPPVPGEASNQKKPFDQAFSGFEMLNKRFASPLTNEPVADAILSNKMRNALERLAICVTGGYRTTIEAVARDCAPIFEELGMSFDGEGWGFYDADRLSAAIGERG